MSRSVGDELELLVGAVAAGGACVARTEEGQVVFVRHTLPGERVVAILTGVTSSFLRADAVSVLSPAPSRVDAPCPFAGPGRCGGCDWQHVSLDEQRALKAALVREQLVRLAGLDPDIVVEELPGAPDGLGWRTRVQLAAAPDGRLGYHRHRSHDLEQIDHCLIATPDVAAIGALDLLWPGASAVEVAADGAQRVVHVFGRGASVPPVEAGVVVEGRPVSVPHGLRHHVLGRSFEVAAGGFWQVHVSAASVLAAAVLDGLDAQPGESVVDLYAGVGLFAALLADRVGPTGSVLAVEASQRACADAARNTADQPWARVKTAEVTPALVSGLAGRRRAPGRSGGWAAASREEGTGGPDLVVLDPPRAGAGLGVTRALAALRPRAVAYVACEPASFARDLKVLLDAGWTMPSLRAFDLFPMTEHVELVALLRPPPAVGTDP